jgi:hypothetical protein
MIKTAFITVEIPVKCEKGPDGWYAYVNVDLCGPDAATPERAIKDLEGKILEHTKGFKKRAREREASGS